VLSTLTGSAPIARRKGYPQSSALRFCRPRFAPDILSKAGGWHPGLYLKINNSPYLELVIEAMGESGPMGLPAISVAHYGQQNGDLMRDPEMCFELGLTGGVHLDPFYWRSDYVAVEQWSRNIIRDHYVCLVQLRGQLTFESI
jgi:hypothetical protein